MHAGFRRLGHLFVRAMLISDKLNPDRTAAYNAWTVPLLPGSVGELYRDNIGPDDSAAYGATDVLTNWMSPINHQRFTVHDQKTFKLKPEAVAAEEWNQMISPGDDYSVSRYMAAPAAMKKLRLSFKCKSRYLRYASAGASDPSGPTPFFVFHIVALQGNTVPDGAVRISGKIRSRWENLT